jgi:hypothetical protein
MKEREWLVQQGLAIAGARGRFSREAKAALAKARADGINIESLTYTPTEVTPVKHKSATIAKSVVQRTETVAWALDKATKTGTTDLVIAISSCSGCNKSISRCTHAVPLLPSWLGGGEALLVKPV